MKGEKPSVLVVDDDESILESLGDYLERHGHKVRRANTGQAALRELEDGVCRLVLLDLRLPDADGVELAGRMLERHQGLVIIIMTAHSTIETAVEAMRTGVYDYMTKPVDLPGVLVKLAMASERLQLRTSTIDVAPSEGNLVGRSPGMLRVRELVRTISTSDMAILICGQTGTGKELVAKALHAGRGAERPFVALNCGAIPEALIESALFGHVRGAFTGADDDKVGLIGQAFGGTLFLDELSSAPLALQVKLLRVLQEHLYTKVGSIEEERADVRIVAAVNEEPRELVRQGRLREDLFYRICAFRIDIPPLRERLSDLPLLVDAILARIGATQGRSFKVTPSLIATFFGYAWPGNVRELENLLTAMVALSPGELLTPAALPPDYRHLGLRAEPEDSAPAGNLATALDEFEHRLITKALTTNAGNLTRTADELGVERRSLMRKIQRLGIPRNPTDV